MGGFFGGQSKTEKQGLNKVDSIFNYGLPAGQEQQAAGADMLKNPADFFEKLLKAGRTDTQLMAAPAINSVIAGGDAVRTQEANRGTGRTGGTAELNREQGGQQSAVIDNMIQQALMGGRTQGAQGLLGIGGLTLENAATLLGLGSGAADQYLNAGTAASDRRASFGRMLTGALLGGANTYAAKKF